MLQAQNKHWALHVSETVSSLERFLGERGDEGTTEPHTAGFSAVSVKQRWASGPAGLLGRGNAGPTRAERDMAGVDVSVGVLRN